MKKEVKERILENNGRITVENDKLLEAEFSYSEMLKAVQVFLDLTENLNQNAVLHGGCRLSVFAGDSETGSQDFRI